MDADPRSHVPTYTDGNAAILVVEDEVLIRLALADELRQHGYRVIEAANAEEALAVIDAVKTVELLITDIQMPGAVNGVQLAQLIRTTRPSTRVVIASGHALDSEASRSADTVFEKPYDPSELAARLKALLSSPER